MAKQNHAPQPIAPKRIAAKPFHLFFAALMAISLFSAPVFAQTYNVNLNIAPTTAFSAMQGSMGFGDVTYGSTGHISIQNDGNTPLLVLVSAQQLQGAQVAFSSKSEETNANGPSCNGEATIVTAQQGSSFVQACGLLGFSDSADQLGIDVALTPTLSAAPGDYKSALAFKAIYSNVEKTILVPITYRIGVQKPAVLKSGQKSYVGQATSVSLSDASGSPLANSPVVVRSPDGKTMQLRTNSLGIATFSPLAQGTYSVSATGTLAQIAQIQVGSAQSAALGASKSSFEGPGKLLLNSLASATSISSAFISSVTLVIPISMIAVLVFAAIMMLALKKGKN